MKKIVITGANGLIGTILREGLKNFDITPMDLPDNDVRNYKNVLKVFPGHDAIVHLAWNTKTDCVLSKKLDFDNSLMFDNVYRGALETGVKRVIIASSVHADSFYGWNKREKLSPNRVSSPDSPYGAHKIFMESLGRYYSKQGLEVVCIRFGGVINGLPEFQNNPDEFASWLSQRDCVELVKKSITAKKIPGNFVVVYGVSDNKKRIHDVSNPFRWSPKECGWYSDKV